MGKLQSGCLFPLPSSIPAHPPNRSPPARKPSPPLRPASALPSSTRLCPVPGPRSLSSEKQQDPRDLAPRGTHEPHRRWPQPPPPAPQAGPQERKTPKPRVKARQLSAWLRTQRGTAKELAGTPHIFRPHQRQRWFCAGTDSRHEESGDCSHARRVHKKRSDGIPYLQENADFRGCFTALSRLARTSANFSPGCQAVRRSCRRFVR